MWDVFSRDAWPGIADVKLHHVFVASQPDGNFAVVGVFDGVVEQVGDDFAHAVGVGEGVIERLEHVIAGGVVGGVNHFGRADHELGAQAFLFGGKAEVVNQLLQKRTNFDDDRVAAESAVLGFGRS